MRAALALVGALLAGCSTPARGAAGSTGSAEHTASAATPSASAAAVPLGTEKASCGIKGAPDCPLQGWMKGNATMAVTQRSFPGLTRVFRRIGELAPPGYEGWDRFAAEGLDAAQRRDVDGCKAACKGCHDEHRKRYVQELRTRPLRP